MDQPTPPPKRSFLKGKPLLSIAIMLAAIPAAFILFVLALTFYNAMRTVPAPTVLKSPVQNIDVALVPVRSSAASGNSLTSATLAGLTPPGSITGNRYPVLISAEGLKTPKEIKDAQLVNQCYADFCEMFDLYVRDRARYDELVKRMESDRKLSLQTYGYYRSLPKIGPYDEAYAFLASRLGNSSLGTAGNMKKWEALYTQLLDQHKLYELELRHCCRGYTNFFYPRRYSFEERLHIAQKIGGLAVWRVTTGHLADKLGNVVEDFSRTDTARKIVETKSRMAR
ncbi:hypothetical protein LLG95_05110 [bacterium]|nr:hypothetical protein [bacterium]